MSTNRDLLRLNVGFIRYQTAGYSREFPFESPSIHLEPDLDLTNLVGYAKATRTAQGLLVQVKLRANVSAECVRCLTGFSLPLEIDFADLYAFSQHTVAESGFLLPENGKVDLGPVVREEMLLAIPISPICDPNCKGFCPVCGEKVSESNCNHEDEDIDPRLSVLKSLIDEG